MNLYESDRRSARVAKSCFCSDITSWANKTYFYAWAYPSAAIIILLRAQQFGGLDVSEFKMFHFFISLLTKTLRVDQDFAGLGISTNGS